MSIIRLAKLKPTQFYLSKNSSSLLLDCAYHSMDYSNDDEWEINTLTSALKSFFRKLPEPVMTYDLHRDFINAAKCETHEDRVAK